MWQYSVILQCFYSHMILYIFVFSALIIRLNQRHLKLFGQVCIFFSKLYLHDVFFLQVTGLAITRNIKALQI